MLIQTVDTYLAVRRAAGFKLDAVESYLRSYAQFATAEGDTHVATQTAIAWAEQSTSEPQRHNRLSIVIRFARFSHAEDNRHEIPPERVFYRQRRHLSPYIFSDEESRPFWLSRLDLVRLTPCVPIPITLCWPY